MDQSTPVLEANQLRLGYRNGKKSITVADEVSFSLKKGKLTCLLGPNGVGKSTLVKTVMGQLPVLGGQVLLEGKPISKMATENIARKIAVVLTDKISTATLNVKQLVELGRIPHTGWLGKLSDHDHQKVAQAIERTNISYLKDQKLSELSDGQLQKAMVARALAQDGDIIILDEPTAHLDLINRFEIMHLLRQIAKKENKAILVVTHDLDIAIEAADEFWLMQCGVPLEQGTPEDLILNGKINLLLPDGKLVFDIISGKVQPTDRHAFPNMEGAAELLNWLRLALRKRGFQISDPSLHFFAQNNPIIFSYTLSGKQATSSSISGLLDQLEKEIE
jgi:iron complex transport system ATP-binding protein